MPTDNNGNYSLPTGYEAIEGETIQPSQHNPPLLDLAQAMTQRMMRSGVAPMTGALKLFDGTVAAPGLTFNSAQSWGFYKTTTGIGVSIGGVKVAEFTAGGIAEGARFVGELIPYTGSTAPALTVLPYGQTLSRTVHARLWAVAQVEIAAGNPFYNNGNGIDTFGIGDMRGRSFRGVDNMGGVAAGNITTTAFGASVTQVGTPGGAKDTTLAEGNLPPHAHTGTTNSGGVDHSHTAATGDASNSFAIGGGGPATGYNNNFGVGGSVPRSITTGGASAYLHTHGFTTGNGAGTSTPISRLAPSIVGNWLLFAGA